MRCSLPAVLLPFVLILPGCAPPAAKRPLAGDRVTPDLTVVEPWPAGGLAHVMLRLHVQGKQDAKPALLQFEEVPADEHPTATIIFWKDDVEIERSTDLAFVPDC